MRKWLFFFFFHEAGGRSGDGTDALLVVGGASVGGASVCDWWSFCWRKNKAFVWGDLKVLFVVKKRSFLPNALWNAFFFL